MRLRPHHLLCTQGFGGKGYSEEFVWNMTMITDYLRNDPDAEVEIVYSTDDICRRCPNMIGIDLCVENGKVKRFDRKVAAYFGIEEKSYGYRDIVHEISSKMTALIMDDICAECNWYSVSDCFGAIVNKAAICMAENDRLDV